MRIAMLTGGGDCPGLNAVMRAVARKGQQVHGDQLLGFRDGWRGVLDDDAVELSIESFRGTLPKGGTILGSSRVNPLQGDSLPAPAGSDAPDRYRQGVERVREVLARRSVDALVAIGGEGTLSITSQLADEGLPMVGVPKTIDNDIGSTELTFGFETAVQICTDTIDRLHTTAESHDRVMVVEVMGRNVGHIATWSAIAGGATALLIPEHPFDIEEVCDVIRRRHARGRYASIVVVAEGAAPVGGDLVSESGVVDDFGRKRLGGIGNELALVIEEKTGFETRAIQLGHVQRGGSPSAFDRVLATRFGVAAVDAVHDGDFGSMVALRAGQIVRVPLREATAELKLVDPEIYEVAKVFFGS